MENLNFDNGLKTYCVNGVREITFNPTDSAFVEKIFDAFDELDKKQDEYKKEIASAQDVRNVFKIARQRDSEMREIIDSIFGDGISNDLFHEMNVYSLAGGLPVWCNFMLSVMDEVNTSFAQQEKETNPRLQKYIEKYRK